MINTDSSYERIYTGSQINANYIKTVLEEEEIRAVIRNIFESALLGGYGSTPNQVQLYVRKEDIVLAKRIVERYQTEDEKEEPYSSKNHNHLRVENELAKKPSSKKGIIFPLILNTFFIGYCLYKLWPLTKGEDVSLWRIIFSVLYIILGIGAIFVWVKEQKNPT